MLIVTQQIKAARALLGWAQQDLAVKSGIAISTIRRIERTGGPICAHFQTIENIRRAFEEAGIGFESEPYLGVSSGRTCENRLG